MATLEQIADALRKADAAGNVEDARALANAYRAMQSQSKAMAAIPVARSAQQMADEMGLPIPGTDWRAPEQSVQYKSPIPGGDFMNELATSFAENIPVVGPLVDRGAQAAGAQLGSMISGQSPEQLQAERDIARARNASDQPIASAAGTVAGAVGPLMAVGQTPLGGNALGITGPMWQRVAFGGISGAALAGADAAARGASPGDVLNQSAVGLGIGGASPIVERLAYPLMRMKMGEISAPAHVRAINTNLERAGIDPANIPQRMANEGPDAMLMDLDPNLARQGGAIASLPGEGQTILRRAVETRQQGAPTRIRTDIDATLGPSSVPSRISADIRASQDALSPAYRDAMQGAKAVDTTPIALNLDSKAVTARGSIQKMARQIREMLDVPGTGQLDRDPSVLLETRHAIDQMFPYAHASGEQAFLTETRRQIDDLLARAVPGIKDVDARFAELARQNDALGTGQQILENGRTAPRPTEVQDMMSAGALPEGTLVGPSGASFRLSQGARAEIERIVGTQGYNLNSLRSALKGDGSWNHERLATLFGKDKADRLLDVLERERTFADTARIVGGNSETAARTAAQKEAQPQRVNLELSRLLTGAPQWAFNMGARNRSESVNKKIAEILMSSPTPEVVDQLISARRLGQALVGSSATPLFVNGP